MSEEQKQALTGLCKIEIKRWKAASESNPNMRYMVELMERALASLTAQPIGRVDRGAATDSNEYPDARVVCLHEHVGWEAFQDGTELFTRPAPAADLAKLSVIVPDQLKIKASSHQSHVDYAEGWSDCIDEVKRLNGVKL